MQNSATLLTGLVTSTVERPLSLMTNALKSLGNTARRGISQQTQLKPVKITQNAILMVEKDWESAQAGLKLG